MLTQIIVADITTLKWRGLVSALTSAPFIINAFIGSNVSTGVLEHSNWRWGYGMFAILIPASLSPLVITLFWAENKARKLGLVQGADVKPKEKGSLVQRAWGVAQQLDIVGLLLLGTAVALILLPLTLAQSAKGMWNNPSMIAMIVVGCILLPVFALWDIYFATRPVIARRFLTNWSVVLASWIGFFDFVRNLPAFSRPGTDLCYVAVLVLPHIHLPLLLRARHQGLVCRAVSCFCRWETHSSILHRTLINATYFSQTQTVGLTVFGIMSGFFLTWFRRYKVRISILPTYVRRD